MKAANGRTGCCSAPPMLRPPKVPCGTCPYRRDVPGGIWEACEYRMLAAYDNPTWNQPTELFLCHNGGGDKLCGGWLLTHDRDELLALRMHAGQLDPSVWDYAPKLAVFASGAEAAAHGMAEIEHPSPVAERKIAGLLRKRAKGGADD